MGCPPSAAAASSSTFGACADSRRAWPITLTLSLLRPLLLYHPVGSANCRESLHLGGNTLALNLMAAQRRAVVTPTWAESPASTPTGMTPRSLDVCALADQNHQFALVSDCDPSHRNPYRRPRLQQAKDPCHLGRKGNSQDRSCPRWENRRSAEPSGFHHLICFGTRLTST